MNFKGSSERLGSEESEFNGFGWSLFSVRCGYLLKIMYELTDVNSYDSQERSFADCVLIYFTVLSPILLAAIPATLLQFHSISPARWSLSKKIDKRFGVIILYWVINSILSTIASICLYCINSKLIAPMIWNCIDGYFTIMTLFILYHQDVVNAYKNRVSQQNEKKAHNYCETLYSVD